MNYGECKVYIQSKELCYRWKLGYAKNRNKLIERKAFVDAVGIKGADLKNESLL